MKMTTDNGMITADVVMKETKDVVTYDEVDKMLEAIENIKLNLNFSPSVGDMKNHDVENNFRKFSPYLLWLQEYFHASKIRTECETCAYISQLFAKRTVGQKSMDDGKSV